MAYIFTGVKMSKSEPNERHLREVLLFTFNLENLRPMIVETYGETFISERMCFDSFKRYKNVDFKVENQDR